MTTTPAQVDQRKRHTSAVLGDVAAECGRIDAKWGEQNHPDGTGPVRPLFGRPATVVRDSVRAEVDRRAQAGATTFSGVLLEEVCEAWAEDDPARLRDELIQIAAVAVTWAKKLDRVTA